MLRTSNLPLRWSWLAALLGGMLHALGDLLNLTHLGEPIAESIGLTLFSKAHRSKCLPEFALSLNRWHHACGGKGWLASSSGLGRR